MPSARLWTAPFLPHLAVLIPFPPEARSDAGRKTEDASVIGPASSVGKRRRTQRGYSCFRNSRTQWVIGSRRFSMISAGICCTCGTWPEPRVWTIRLARPSMNSAWTTCLVTTCWPVCRLRLVAVPQLLHNSTSPSRKTRFEALPAEEFEARRSRDTVSRLASRRRQRCGGWHQSPAH
jgi:hypothetical protein